MLAFVPKFQGHPLDFHCRISVLQANSYWLEDMEVMKCPWKESGIGKKKFWVSEGIWCLEWLLCVIFSETSPPLFEGLNDAFRPYPLSYQFLLPPTPHTHTTTNTKGLNCALWPHPNWPVMSGHTSARKLPSKSGCRL